MRTKKSLLIKQKIVLILLLFSIFAFAGIIYTFDSSRKLDIEHINLVENSEKIETKIFNARIHLENFLESGKASSYSKVEEFFAKAYNNAHLIEDVVSKKRSYGSTPQDDFLKDLFTLRKSIRNLDSLMRGSAKKDSEKDLDLAMEHFSEVFTKFEKSLHLYINESNYRLKREIFFLLAAIFISLIISLVLVVRLMNSLIRTNRQLVRNTMTVEQRERKRIAMDLHDGLGAMLSSVGMYSKILEKDLKDDKQTVEKLSQITQLSKQALDTVAEVINNLNPSVLNRYNLEESLERLVSKINRLGKVDVVLNTKGLVGQPQKSTEVILYRICSELINNTLKYANATKVHIKLSGDTVLRLFYADNGDGFDINLHEKDERKGMGLQNILERVESIGGQCQLISSPGKGFSLEIQFAINKQN